jgi:hypothetical protein
MTGAAILAPTLLALGAAFCFALALILTQYGLRTVPSWRSPIYTIGSSMIAAWLGALLFVDWRGFDWRAALIFAGVGWHLPGRGVDPVRAFQRAPRARRRRRRGQRHAALRRVVRDPLPR